MNLEDLGLGQIPDIRTDDMKEGWVYLVHAEGSPRYKIGETKDPISRLKTLKNQSPYPNKVVDMFWTPDTKFDETGLHEILKSNRKHGEWFEVGFLHQHGFKYSNGTPSGKKIKQCEEIKYFICKYIEGVYKIGVPEYVLDDTNDYYNTSPVELITLHIHDTGNALLECFHYCVGHDDYSLILEELERLLINNASGFKTKENHFISSNKTFSPFMEACDTLKGFCIYFAGMKSVLSRKHFATKQQYMGGDCNG